MIQPRKIKQGKDIAIAWNVPRKDNINMTIQQATSLSVWFVNRKNRIKIQPSLFDVRDNIIYIQLTGSAQKYTGIYDIECVYQFPSLIMTSGVVNCPRDYQGAFEIVSKESGDDYGDLPASLQLDSSIEYAFRGLSAYELAVQQGFEGTLDEWLESLNGSGVGGGLTQSQKNWIGEGIVLVNEGSSLPEAININTQEIVDKAPKDHTHDYAPVSHNHDSVYAPKAHTHTGFALESHNHDLVYAPKDHTHDYAPVSHNHDSVYAPKAHTHNDKLDAPEVIGTSGQVLTITESGVEWKTPVSGGGSSGTGEGLTEAQKAFLGSSVDLQTESKDSLPSAINEVAGEVQKVWNELHNNNYGNDWYGVIRSGDVATPDLIRIGNMVNHRTLPYHNKIRPCIVRSDRTIAYFLDNNDITKKEDGTDSVLDGTDGVMCVYYPAGYIIIASGQEQNMDINAISETPFAVNGIIGKKFEAFVVSMDYATVRRSDNALMCVINETADYAGSGANNTAGGIGYARTSVNNYNYTLYARNYGEGWTNSFFYFEQIKTALMIIEYATYNLAKAYNATLSAEGFKQGGLGVGPQNWSGGDWNTYNGYSPVVKIGEVQKYISGLSSNGTGVYTKTIQATETKSYTTPFPCWRWSSNLWGHLWNWYSGVDIDMQPNTSDTPYSTIYYTKQPTVVLATNDSDFTFVEKYIKIGLLPRSGGNFKELIGGAFLPKSNGGGSATWGCAYFWTSIPASRERRGFLSGAALDDGGCALRASANSYGRPSNSLASIGSGLSAYVAE